MYGRDCRSPGAFRRTFTFGPNIEKHHISATMESGVLTITLPYKTASPQNRGPRRVPVEGPASPPRAFPRTDPGPSHPAAAAAPAIPSASGNTASPEAESAQEEGWVAVEATAMEDKGKAPMSPEEEAAREASARQLEEEKDGSVEDCEY